jgi:hypothetical protein
MAHHHSLRMRLVTGSVVLLVGGLAVACGPSLKAAVESDMRFEHCYRIDDDPSTTLPSKRHCWTEWTARYTRGQARERINYAKSRIKVLDGAMAAGPPPVATTAATAAACPSPSNPYAPPPAVAPKSTEAVTPASSACSDACSKAWKTCSTPCGVGASCVLACDEKFRLCAKACL